MHPARLPACLAVAPRALDEALVPSLASDEQRTWQVAVLYGPHGAPDFFTEEAIEEFRRTFILNLIKEEEGVYSPLLARAHHYKISRNTTTTYY